MNRSRVALPDGRLSLPVWFGYRDEEALAADCLQAQLTVRFFGQYYLEKPRRSGLLLGCAGVGGQALETAARRIAAIIQHYAI